ncbi:MAG: mannose-6-phosphate isomerase-like protein (cupin superfamily) [Candidatus Azotimanducaceae bacterium]
MTTPESPIPASLLALLKDQMSAEVFSAGSSSSRNEPQAPLSEELTTERLHVVEYFNHERNPAFSLARCRVPSGVTTEKHSLSVAEWYVVESGQGKMYLGDEEIAVGAGDTVQIPVGTAQNITNHGAEDLIFFSICLPRFEWETYQSLE